MTGEGNTLKDSVFFSNGKEIRKIKKRPDNKSEDIKTYNGKGELV